MKKIRVTVLVSSLHIGGAEQLLLDLLRNISTQKLDLLVCFLREPGMLGREVLTLGHRCRTHLLRSRWDPLGVLKTARLFREEKTDLLFLINHRNALFHGVLGAKIAGVPAIVNWENETFKTYSFNFLTVLNHRLLHLGVDEVVAAAMGHADYLVAHEKVPRRKVTTIYNCVDPAKFRSNLSRAEARIRLGIPVDSPVVSVIGVLRPDKNHRMFLEAARRVLDEIPAARFLIIGDGPERKGLEEEAGRLEIAGAVHFLGFRRDLGDLLAAVDVNALSSKPEQETLSVAVVEAMSAGIPIVSTDVGFMNEVVIPEKTGYLVPVGDASSLASGIL
ncbi:MAG TPA: glycosyltransferase, partial [Syntrophobacteraceae bacterium]|nr:glycosyltransferase [Syntrophobacteraceae bacterium]